MSRALAGAVVLILFLVMIIAYMNRPDNFQYDKTDGVQVQYGDTTVGYTETAEPATATEQCGAGQVLKDTGCEPAPVETTTIETTTEEEIESDEEEETGTCACYEYSGSNCMERGRSDGILYTRVPTQCSVHKTRQTCEGARKANSVPFCKFTPN